MGRTRTTRFWCRHFLKPDKEIDFHDKIITSTYTSRNRLHERILKRILNRVTRSGTDSTDSGHRQTTGVWNLRAGTPDHLSILHTYFSRKTALYHQVMQLCNENLL